MIDSRKNFAGRLRMLNRKHRKMANGYTTHIRGDGLIVARPARRKPARQSPLFALMLVVAGFLIFKGYLMASLGQDGYADRVAQLQAGTAVEQAGAAVMQVDPVSLFVYSMFSKDLNG